MKEYKKNIKTYVIKKNKTNIPSAKMTTSKNAYDYIKKYLYDESIDVYESFYLLLLNRANNITGFVKISQGGVSKTIIDTKLIAKYVVDELAESVILAHNHPSGSTKPSQADKDITARIKKGLDLFNSIVLDHIILTSENGYYSFADENIL